MLVDCSTVTLALALLTNCVAVAGDSSVGDAAAEGGFSDDGTDSDEPSSATEEDDSESEAVFTLGKRENRTSSVQDSPSFVADAASVEPVGDDSLVALADTSESSPADSHVSSTAEDPSPLLIPAPTKLLPQTSKAFEFTPFTIDAMVGLACSAMML